MSAPMPAPDGDQAPDTVSELDAIASATGDTREILIARFMVDRERLFGNFATNMSKRWGIQAEQRDDALSEVRLVALAMLRDLPNGPITHTWEGYFHSVVNGHFRKLDEAGAFRADPPAPALSRRQRKLVQTRDRLRAELGREPSKEEIIRAWNAEALERFSNPRKQGMLLSDDDFQSRYTVSIDETDASGRRLIEPAEIDTSDDFVLHRSEGPTFLKAILARCLKDDQMVGKVAMLWIGDVLTGRQKVRKPPEIAEELGLTYNQVRPHYLRAKALAYQTALDWGMASGL